MKHPKANGNKNLPLVFLFTAIIALAGFSAGASVPPDLFVLGPDEFAPGAKASLRIILMEPTGLTTSEPISGAAVKIILDQKGWRRDRELYRGKTNRDGTLEASFSVPEIEPGTYSIKVLASSRIGEVEATHTAEIQPRVRILLNTDKPIYQPSQTIHIRALALRTHDLKPVEYQRIVIEVEDAKANKVFKKRLKTDLYGIASADFVLADEINLGEYNVRAILEGQTEEKSVMVSRYVLPKFKVSIETDKNYYMPGETVSGVIRAKYFFGKPISGGLVEIDASGFDFEFHSFAKVSGETDKDGNYEFEFELPEFFAGQPLEQGDAFVKINAKITDKAEHSEEADITRKVADSRLRLELVPEGGRLIPGVTNIIYAVTSTPDDSPTAARIRLVIGGKTYTAKSDEAGVAEIAFIPKAAEFMDQGHGGKDRYSLEVKAEAKDRYGNRTKITRKLSADYLKDTVLLRLDKAIYEGTDDLNIQVFSTGKTGTIYLDVIKNRKTILTRSLDLSNGRARTRLSLGPDAFGTLEIHAYKILPSGEIMRDSRVCYVNPPDQLRISAKLDKDTYLPGSEALIKFKVTDRRGRGKACALGIVVVDESVYALQEIQPGLLKVYFTLEKELAKPRYELHFASGPGSVQAMIKQDAKIDSSRQKMAKVLLAGVSEPTKYAWQENPARGRQKKEMTNLANLYSGLYQFGLQNQIARYNRSAGYWEYEPGLINRIIKKGYLNKKQATDSWGRNYDLNQVGDIYGPLELNSLCKALASQKILQVYSALYNYSCQHKSESADWLDRLFNREDRERAWSFPDDVLERLVDEGHLDRSYLTDPWGYKVRLVRVSTSENNPYASELNGWLLRSVGPDGKPGTNDDVTNPYIYQHAWSDMKMPRGKDGVWRNRAFAVAEKAIPQAFPMPAMEADKGSSALGYIGTAGGADRKARKAQIHIREYFPETLLWIPSLITDSRGRAQLRIPMADSITTWRMSATAHSLDGLFGSFAQGIRAFQDFFVDIDFPTSLTQGDEVSVPVAVYNYLDSSQEIELEAELEDWFELLGDRVQKIELEAGEVGVRFYRIKVKGLGKKTLTIYALGEGMDDAIKRSVEILPDGRRFDTVANGQLAGRIEKTIEIPGDAIDGASKLIVKIYPGVFSQVLEGMDGIFRMPNGCFEQTTSTTYPNVMVLAYMKKTGQIKPDIQMKAEGFINLGYQRLLSFEVPGGGFEWFGQAPAHKVLTAYGLMEFSDMSKVYDIDEDVITRTQRWLVDQQEKDGSWKPVQHWLETLSSDAFSRSTLLNTAYITWALLESGYQGNATDKAAEYIKAHMQEAKDAYTLALAANALVNFDPRDKETRALLDRIHEIRIEDAKTRTVHWEPAGETAVHGTGSAAAIETTALILYSFIKANVHIATVNKGMNWLTTQKDSFGTFQTTQATILTLKTLLAAEAGAAEDVRAEIMVNVNGERKVVKITPEDSDVLRLLDFKGVVREGKNDIVIEPSQELGLMYQVAAAYYLPWQEAKGLIAEEPLTIELKYDRTELAADETLTADVRVAYRAKKRTEMIILDLGIPPGFKVLTEAFEELKNDGKIEKYTMTGRQITVYVREILPKEPLTFSYKLKAKYPVKAKTPKSSAYEYYTPDIRDEVEPVKIEVSQ